jgi:adenine phosphoribosyltransferase
MPSSDPNGLRKYIRDVPDFPKQGVLFRDLTPLLADVTALRRSVQALSEPFRNQSLDYVIGTEARGFLFGVPVALELGVGFVPVRKPGKLPSDTFEASYELEYGRDLIEIHQDALHVGSRVLVVDDLIATGGTAAATVDLARQAGALVVGCAFVIELSMLSGRETLAVEPCHTLIRY